MYTGLQCFFFTEKADLCLIHICPRRCVYNKFAYNILCWVLGGIVHVGGYTLQRMCSHCLWASCHFLNGPSGISQGKSVQQRLIGDCTKIVQSQCSCCAVSATSTWKSYGARAAPVQRLRGDGAVTMQPPCHFWAAVPVQRLCSATVATYMYDMSTDLHFFKFV